MIFLYKNTGKSLDNELTTVLYYFSSTRRGNYALLRNKYIGRKEKEDEG